jgi:WS/DGAT/MGAT family acyltransferase
MYLRDETAAWPTHFGGLAVVEGRALLDSSGQLRAAEIKARLDRRLARVPQLRRRVFVPGLPRGGPLWVDDQRFAIEQHVQQSTVQSPGGDAELLEAAARLYEPLLDRSRPLWELWFLTGLSDGRVGVLLKLHHAVADGPAAVALMAALFDLEPDAADPLAVPWTPEPMPGAWSLLADNLSNKIRTVGRGAGLLAHPLRIVRGARVFALVVRRCLGQKGRPRSSLNQVVRAGRRVRFLRLDLTAMKEAAHAHGGTVNDVVLDVWSGGLRQLLVSRGEPVADVELMAALAVSLRSPTDAGTIDNRAGTIVLPLPAWEADAQRRLDLIVRTTREAKARRQLPAAIMGVMAMLAATPLGQYLNLHQRAVNVIVTNVVGPPVPMYVFGARILDIVPIIQLVGNIGLTMCAFSYAGQLSLVVTADATAFPDLDVLMQGMERDWDALTSAQVAEAVPA